MSGGRLHRLGVLRAVPVPVFGLTALGTALRADVTAAGRDRDCIEHVVLQTWILALRFLVNQLLDKHPIHVGNTIRIPADAVRSGRQALEPIAL